MLQFIGILKVYIHKCIMYMNTCVYDIHDTKLACINKPLPTNDENGSI